MGMTAVAVRNLVHYATTSPPSTPETSPASPAPVFDNFIVIAIQCLVHRKVAEKQHLTVGGLTEELKTATITPDNTSETSVWRLMHTMGFRYKTSHRKTYVRKESLDVVCRRIAALRALQRHREEGRQVLYVDETWFTTRMGHSREWVDTTQAATSATYSRQMPPGEGERFVVVTAGMTNGFVEGSYLCYLAKTTQGDYHGEMNAELFHW